MACVKGLENHRTRQCESGLESLKKGAQEAIVGNCEGGTWL